MNREEALKLLAKGSEKKRARAAQQLQAAGLRIVATKDRAGIEVDATLDMWAHPDPVEFWGRKRLPVVDPVDALPGKVLELDPIDGYVLSDGFNHRTAADWKGVSDELRALVRWGIQRGRLAFGAGDAVDLAAQLQKGELAPRLRALRQEAPPDELAAAGKELRRVERPAPGPTPVSALAAAIKVTLTPSDGLIGPYTEAEISAALAPCPTCGTRLDEGGCRCIRPSQTLEDFLASAFGPDELRRFVGDYYGRCENSINWRGAQAHVAFSVVATLKNHGVLTGVFWAALTKARPGRAAEIATLRRTGTAG